MRGRRAVKRPDWNVHLISRRGFQGGYDRTNPSGHRRGSLIAGLCRTSMHFSITERGSWRRSRRVTSSKSFANSRRLSAGGLVVAAIMAAAGYHMARVSLDVFADVHYHERGTSAGSPCGPWVAKTAGGRKTVEAVETSVRAHTHFSAHQRTWALLPKCGARTRSGRPCLGLVVRGKRRCRMHGGAARSGAQPGNRNRWRHGRYSRRALEVRALCRLLEGTQALVSAYMALVDAVARANTEQFSRAAVTAAHCDQDLRKVALVMHKSAARTGWASDVQDLLAVALDLLPDQPQADVR